MLLDDEFKGLHRFSLLYTALGFGGHSGAEWLICLRQGWVCPRWDMAPRIQGVGLHLRAMVEIEQIGLDGSGVQQTADECPFPSSARY